MKTMNFFNIKLIYLINVLEMKYKIFKKSNISRNTHARNEWALY